MKSDALLFIDDHRNDEDLLFAGFFVPDIIKERLLSSGLFDRVWVSLLDSYNGRLSSWENVFVRTSDDIASWKELVSKSDADAVVRIYGDSPFIDADIVREMLEIHGKYCAEFTYSENVTSGLSCEIFSTELITSLPATDDKRLPLSQIIRSNINQFDVELYYKAPDLRDFRLSFRSSIPREKAVMEGLFARAGDFPKYKDLRNLILGNGDILYCAPSYLEVELTGRAECETIYSWRKGVSSLRGDMEPVLFKKLISDMSGFGLPYSICLGGSGDPMLHTSFYECLEAARGESLVSRIFIETDGVKMDTAWCEYLSRVNDSRITMIIDMSGYNAESYETLHGKNNFELVKGNICAVRDIVGEKNERLYVQLMKIKETETLIDAYYDFWEAQKVNIILQKQNVFLGAIEDRRYYDLTPLDRCPCWHLQRDLFIMSDGRVGFCKQDINGSFSKWDAGTKSLSEIWALRAPIFINDFKGNRATQPDCALCDEWYTFNF